jgi:hypothetical protein
VIHVSQRDHANIDDLNDRYRHSVGVDYGEVLTGVRHWLVVELPLDEQARGGRLGAAQDSRHQTIAQHARDAQFGGPQTGESRPHLLSA